MENLKFGFRSLFMLPTGEVYPPVSAGELPSHGYQVSIETLTEKVAAHLEAYPETPGVMLMEKDRLHSMIPRARFFERLGHRFGIELFMRKPIVELQENIGTEAHVISSNTRVHDAVNIALNRGTKAMYDPLVLRYDDGRFRMLDAHILLMAQSLASENMSNVVSNMHRIEQSIKAEIPLDAALEMFLDAIKRVAPHHRAAVLVKSRKWEKLSSYHSLLVHMSEHVGRQPLIRSICDFRQPIHVEDTSLAPDWNGAEFLGKANVWLGLPIASGSNMDGVLSLTRLVNTPFTKNEIDMAKTFAEFLSIAINKTAEGYDERQLTEMVQRKFL